MPRCNRYFLPDKIWHITHRCHKREFLLKFKQNRNRWIHWLFEAKKRYNLCVLNYCVTSNHIHLLVFDRGKKEIIKSRNRYRIIGREKLSELLGLSNVKELPDFYKQQTKYLLNRIKETKYEPEWTESIAIGSESFLREVKKTVMSKRRKVKVLSNGITILS